MKKVISFVIYLGVALHATSQVSINTTGASPHATSILEISHDSFEPKGVLIPRMGFGDILSIPSPAQGLMVYDTFSNRFWYFTGAYWDKIGEGFWTEAGPGIQSSPDHVGIGLISDASFGLRVNHPSLTAIAAFSGSITPTISPLVPSSIFGVGVNGSDGAQFLTDSSGTALYAESIGTGHAAKFKGGNVYIEKRLGIGVENPADPFVVNATEQVVGRFNSTQNTMVMLARNGYQGGFLQLIDNGGNTDFYLGKTIGQGLGDLHLYNQGRAFTIKNNGTFSFNQPAADEDLLIEIKRNTVQQGFIHVHDDIINLMTNVITIGKPGATGDIRFENNEKFIVFEPDGDVGIGTNIGVTFPPVPNKLRIESENTSPVLSSNVKYSGNFDVRAVEGISTPAHGYGYGGWFKGGYYGVYAESAGQTYAGECIGVYAKATGSAGTRTGLYASASGGTTNWAGFFAEGNVYIGASLRIGTAGGASGYKLSVDGKIMGEELKIQDSDSWPDYVFDESYSLMPLEDLERSIKQNKHLPGIPSAAEVAVNGIMVGEMQKKMMEKIEELTLHVIALQKRVVELEALQN